MSEKGWTGITRRQSRKGSAKVAYPDLASIIPRGYWRVQRKTARMTVRLEKDRRKSDGAHCKYLQQHKLFSLAENYISRLAHGKIHFR